MMMFRLEARPEPSRTFRWASPLVAVGLTIAVGLVLFPLMGRNALDAFHAFFVKPIDSLYGVAELLLKASPLMLIATGLAAGYRANVWNIGAEGQLTLGAIAGGGVALAMHGVDSPFVLPLMLVAGVAGGVAWAAIPAWLRDRLPVLWVDGEPAWVGGIGVAAEFACAPGAAGLVPEWRPGGVTPAPPP